VRAVLVVLVVSSSASAMHATPAGSSNHSPRTSVLLPPSAFQTVPAAIRSALEKRGSRIPAAERVCNVLRGQFEKRGQRDWAVFSVGDSSSSLLIFWKGNASRMEEVERGQIPDVDAMKERPCFFTVATPHLIRTFLDYWR